MNQLICTAIRERLLLAFDYHGHPRVVEPHAYGLDTKGRQTLSAYQVKGSSQSQDMPGWKTFHTDEMRSLSLLQQHFFKPRSAYKKSDKRMKTVFCEL